MRIKPKYKNIVLTIMEEDKYKVFNHALKHFMRELMKLFPNMIELKLMFTLYKFMKTVNRKSPQQYFHELVDVHSNELLSKNFDYFMSKEFDDAQVTKILTALKKEFVLLDDHNKDVIWQHVVTLYYLSIKCENKTL